MAISSSSTTSQSSGGASLSSLPDDELQLILEACDLPAHRSLRSVEKRLARISRQVVRSVAFRGVAANLEALQLAAWRESPTDRHEQRLQTDRHGSLSDIYSVSLDGGAIASAGSDRLVRLWRLGESPTVAAMATERHAAWPRSLPTDPASLRLEGPNAPAHDAVAAWRLELQSPVAIRTCMSRCVALRGERVAFGCDDGTVVLARSRLLGADGTTSPFTPLTADGKVDQLGELRVFKGHRDRVTCLCWAGHGRLLSGGLDRTVRLWDTDAKEGGCVVLSTSPPKLDRASSQAPSAGRTLTRAVRCVAACEDGRLGCLLAAGGDDHLVHVWSADRADGVPELLCVLSPYQRRSVEFGSAVTALALGHGRCAVAYADGDICVWDLNALPSAQTGRVAGGGATPRWGPEPRTIEMRGASSAVTGSTALALGGARTLVSAGGRDKRAVYIWDLEPRPGLPPAVVAKLPHLAVVTTVAARGGVVVSGDSAGVVRLWRCPAGLAAAS